MAAVALLAFAAQAAADKPYRFGAAEPITDMGDRRPVPVPSVTEYEQGEYSFRSSVRYPAVGLTETWQIPRSSDVNALDEVPASSWFASGSAPPALDAVRAGPTVIGPPALPLTVIQAWRADGGLLASDTRDELWLVSFDPPGHAALQTTAGLLASRVFGALGYNVPEDHLVDLRREDLTVHPKGPATGAELDALLGTVALPAEGRWRARVSRHLDGIVLGPFSPRGVRADDPNDHVPHEDRRVLRALRVFGAFINLQEIRPANTLDVYEGPRDRGFVRHYLLDMGQAFGGYAAGSRRYWSGYNHDFSLGDALKNLASVGFHVGPWEKEAASLWRSVGTFESTLFDPRGWRETAAFAPIRRSLPEDDYWAAKRLLALDEAHVEALVSAARFPEAGAAEYMVRTLLERRRKLLAWAFARVGPLELLGLEGTALRLRDLGALPEAGGGAATSYRVRVHDGGGRVLAEVAPSPAGATDLEVSLERFDRPRHVYLRVEIEIERGGRRAPRPAEFHLRPGSDGAWRVVGVVH